MSPMWDLEVIDTYDHSYFVEIVESGIWDPGMIHFTNANFPPFKREAILKKAYIRRCSKRLYPVPGVEDMKIHRNSTLTVDGIKIHLLTEEDE